MYLAKVVVKLIDVLRCGIIVYIIVHILFYTYCTSTTVAILLVIVCACCTRVTARQWTLRSLKSFLKGEKTFSPRRMFWLKMMIDDVRFFFTLCRSVREICISQLLFIKCSLYNNFMASNPTRTVSSLMIVFVFFDQMDITK